MSRQIIKTRSQRPYVVARIVLVAIVIIVIAIAIAYVVAEKRARTHDATFGFPPATAQQDSAAAVRNSKNPHISTF